MKILEIFDRNLSKIAPYFIMFLTFCYSLSRIPFYDEAHAYIISRLPVADILYLTSIEGHSALWYLLLKLTCFDINLYPYDILFLNWIIGCALILFIFKKTPFNNLVKTLICLSCPFFHYFFVVARPYGLSVLLMLALAVVYKNNAFKSPFLFSILLVLCAYTGIVGIVCSFAFFVLFFV